MKTRKISLFLSILLFFTSCIPFRYAGKKPAQKVYEQFFVDQGVMQYFVKPLTFYSKKYKYTVDFTFRDTIADNSFVTANFSVFSKEKIKNIDSVYFIANNKKYYFQNCKKMFLEKDKKKYQIRYTSGITLRDFEKFCSIKPNIYVFVNNDRMLFKPTKKVLKSLRIVKGNILDIIIYNRSKK
jgi:hypothetical protein